MSQQYFNDAEDLTIMQAFEEAQKIAFAPVVFQVAKTLRDLGILTIITKAKNGITLNDLVQQSNLSEYAIKVLTETAFSAKILYEQDDKIHISKVGVLINSDEMTRVNINYNHYVNYLGLYNLKESILEGKAKGLKTFGDWQTIYPALSSLPDDAKQAWFDFDHFYSDSGFEEAIEYLSKLQFKSILDIGGNTGKFAIAMTSSNPETHVTIMDLPQQIQLAKQNIYQQNLTNISFIGANVLTDQINIPEQIDLVWMSQFLDCFADPQIEEILLKIKASIQPTTQICIMEPFWDRQNNKIAAYSVINTSPYFTAMANGYSKMFRYSDFEKVLTKAGFEILEILDNIGVCQTIIRLQIKAD